METDSSKKTMQFNSLEEIEAYRDQLMLDLHKDEERIASLWKGLFCKEQSRRPKTPMQRVLSMVNVGSGVLDGVILGWKLYRKFSGGRLWGSHR